MTKPTFCVLAAIAIASFVAQSRLSGEPVSTPPKPDGEIVGQWKWDVGVYLTLYRAKDGLKMLRTMAKDNATISDELVTAKSENGRYTVRPIKTNDFGEYWTLDEDKNLILYDSEGLIAKAPPIPFASPVTASQQSAGQANEVPSIPQTQPSTGQTAGTETWTAKDGRTTQGKFVRLEGESVVVEKDGETFTIPFSNLEAWSVVQAKKLGGLLKSGASGGSSQTSTSSPSTGSPQEKLDAYIAVISSDSIASKLVKRVGAEQRGERWTATLTVENLWHVRNKQVRLQDAQNLWKAWAVIASPDRLDMARIRLVDSNGNEVGGSRVLGGSMLWVQD